eukprot:6211049-Pleurochrysis_carterae.AAC.3
MQASLGGFCRSRRQKLREQSSCLFIRSRKFRMPRRSVPMLLGMVEWSISHERRYNCARFLLFRTVLLSDLPCIFASGSKG